MNIPEEVMVAASDAFDATFNGPGDAATRAEYGVVAEWARREALREAADAIRTNAGEEDESGICEGVSNWPDASARTYSFATHEAIEAVRALAEGEQG